MDLIHSKFNQTIRQYHVCVNHLLDQSVHQLISWDQVYLEDAVNQLYVEETFQHLLVEREKVAKRVDNAEEEIMFHSLL